MVEFYVSVNSEGEARLLQEHWFSIGGAWASGVTWTMHMDQNHFKFRGTELLVGSFRGCLITLETFLKLKKAGDDPREIGKSREAIIPLGSQVSRRSLGITLNKDTSIMGTPPKYIQYNETIECSPDSDFHMLHQRVFRQSNVSEKIHDIDGHIDLKTPIRDY